MTFKVKSDCMLMSPMFGFIFVENVKPKVLFNFPV